MWTEVTRNENCRRFGSSLHYKYSILTGNAWYLSPFISFKIFNILVHRAYSTFIGHQIDYLYAHMGTKDIGLLHEAATSAPWEEIAKLGVNKAKVCEQGKLLIHRRRDWEASGKSKIDLNQLNVYLSCLFPIK